MTTTTTDYLRANVPRGKPFPTPLGSWSDGSTPEITLAIPANTYFYMKELLVSMNHVFYANADAENVIGTGANTLLVSYPNSLSGEANNIKTIFIENLRELFSHMEKLEGDSTVGYYGKITFEPALKLVTSASQKISIKFTDTGTYIGATTTTKAFGGAASSGLIEFAANGWLIDTADDT